MENAESPSEYARDRTGSLRLALSLFSSVVLMYVLIGWGLYLGISRVA